MLWFRAPQMDRISQESLHFALMRAKIKQNASKKADLLDFRVH